MPVAHPLTDSRDREMIFRPFSFALIFLVFPVSFLGQSGKAEQPMTVPHMPVAPMRVRVPLISEPLKLSDFAGMTPRPELRDTLGVVRDFIQNAPNDGKPATERTEVWMAHTKTHLYFVFLCFDGHPGQIRGHLARRENILMDDFVQVLLDPFEDRRKGILFSVNPAGVQADATWTENNFGPDYSYDQVWIRGPGNQPGLDGVNCDTVSQHSLYPAQVANWGVVFMRNLPRNGEATIGRGWRQYLRRAGRSSVDGLEGLTGSHDFQLNPYVLSQNERTLINIDPLNPYFSARRLEGTAGGEAKAILRDSIVVDGTINPDFGAWSRISPQFTVDRALPGFLPELPPLLLGGSASSLLRR